MSGARHSPWPAVRSVATWAGLAAAALYAAAQGSYSLLRRSEDLLPDALEYEGSLYFISGIALHVIERGQGPALVLIPGFSGSTFNFRNQVPVFAHDHRVIAVDLPGFGYAGRPHDADLSLTAHAARVWVLLERMSVDRLILIGHSMGGAIAARMAVERPGRVERLVLVSATHPGHPGAALLPAALRRFAIIPAALLAWQRDHLRRWMRRVVYDPAIITDEVWESCSRPWRVRGTMHTTLRLMSDVRRDPPLDPARISIRTLLLWGEADQIVPLTVAHDLHRRIPDARLEVLPRAGHLPLEEQPDAATDAITRFLRERVQEVASA